MVIERELRVVSRRAGTYWVRAAAVAFAATALLQNVSRPNGGRNLFFTGLTLAFIVAIIDAIRRGSVAVSEEKDEGTFSLLTLTPLSGPEILFGKFAAAALASFQTALACAPVLAASLLIGGISAGELVRSAIALAYVLSLTLIISLCVATKVDEPIRAALRSGFWIVAGLVLLTPCAVFDVAALRMINPISPLFLISDMAYVGSKWAFWVSMFLAQAVAWRFFHLRGKRLIGEWREEQETSRTALPEPSGFPQSVEEAEPLFQVWKAPRWFQMNPFQWLTMRDLRMHAERRTLITTVAVYSALSVLTCPIGIATMFAAAATLLIWFCIAAAQTVARSRRTGFLELLLTTPLAEGGVVSGHIAAMRHTFAWPFAITALATSLTGSWLFRPAASWQWQFALYLLAGAALIFWAAPWIGMLAALQTNTVARAMLVTILLVVVVPRLFFCYMGDAPYFAIVGLIARSIVRRDFRRLVAEGFSK